MITGCAWAALLPRMARERLIGSGHNGPTTSPVAHYQGKRACEAMVRRNGVKTRASKE